MDHPNVKLAERTWESVTRSDVASLKRSFGDDLIWHVCDTSPWSGDLVGADDIIDYLADMGDSTDDYTISLEDIVANDQHVILLAHVNAHRGEHSLDTSYVMVGKVTGPRISELWTVALDTASVGDFWGCEESYPALGAAELLAKTTGLLNS